MSHPHPSNILGSPEEMRRLAESIALLPADATVRGMFPFFVKEYVSRSFPEVFARLAPVLSGYAPSPFGQVSLSEALMYTASIASHVREHEAWELELLQATNQMMERMVERYQSKPIFKTLTRVADGSFHGYLKQYQDMEVLLWSGRAEVRELTPGSAQVVIEYPYAQAAGYFAPGFMRGILSVFDVKGTITIQESDGDRCVLDVVWQ